VNNDLISLAENIIKSEISSLPPKIDADKKQQLYNLLTTGINKKLDMEDLIIQPANTREKIIKMTIKWCTKELLRMFKTPVPEDYYHFVTEIILESLIETTIICLEAEFDREEFIRILNEEATTGLELGITILKDEEKIDDACYQEAMKIAAGQ
jgi:hypothetical protein